LAHINSLKTAEMKFMRRRGRQSLLNKEGKKMF